ncbi:fimbrial protein [Providencia stuartii]
MVDLSKSIFCRNDEPRTRRDMVSMIRGSAYGGALSKFTGVNKVLWVKLFIPSRLTNALAEFSLR